MRRLLLAALMTCAAHAQEGADFTGLWRGTAGGEEIDLAVRTLNGEYLADAKYVARRGRVAHSDQVRVTGQNVTMTLGPVLFHGTVTGWTLDSVLTGTWAEGDEKYKVEFKKVWSPGKRLQIEA